jgi:hypothetical protein
MVYELIWSLVLFVGRLFANQENPCGLLPKKKKEGLLTMICWSFCATNPTDFFTPKFQLCDLKPMLIQALLLALLTTPFFACLGLQRARFTTLEHILAVLQTCVVD